MAMYLGMMGGNKSTRAAVEILSTNLVTGLRTEWVSRTSDLSSVSAYVSEIPPSPRPLLFPPFSLFEIQ